METDVLVVLLFNVINSWPVAVVVAAWLVTRKWKG